MSIIYKKIKKKLPTWVEQLTNYQLLTITINYNQWALQEKNMIKKTIRLRVVIVLFSAISSMSMVQSMGYYGPQPMPGQMGKNSQRKQMKKQMKPQVKAQFYQQNPRATDKQWDQYWDNYKRQNGLKD